jgi:hypothetical protein
MSTFATRAPASASLPPDIGARHALRSPVERVPIRLIDGVTVDGLAGFQVLGQEAEALHLADVVLVGAEAGHVESLANHEAVVGVAHGGQRGLVDRIGGILEDRLLAQTQPAGLLG